MPDLAPEALLIEARRHVPFQEMDALCGEHLVTRATGRACPPDGRLVSREDAARISDQVIVHTVPFCLDQ